MPHRLRHLASENEDGRTNWRAALDLLKVEIERRPDHFRQPFSIYEILHWSDDRPKARRHLRPRTRMIAVADVLGFRSMLDSSDLSEFAARYASFAADAIERSRQHVWHVDDAKDRRRHPVKSAVFSDTILMWSVALTPTNAATVVSEFFRVVVDLLQEGLAQGLPIRMGVAKGDCVVNRARSTFVGQPIVDAYITEGRQEWCGVALHPSALDGWAIAPDDGARATEAFRTAGPTDNVPKKGRNSPPVVVLVEYPIPVKEPRIGKPELRFTLDWLNDPDLVTPIAANLSSTAGTANSAKWENTLKFAEYCSRLESRPPPPKKFRLGPGGYEWVIVTDLEPEPIIGLNSLAE